jgi:cytochrome c oxidase subunit 2
MRRKLLSALTLGLVLASATGCSSSQLPRLGLPTPRDEQGKTILFIWQSSWIAALAVGVLVWGLILWSVFFHRRSRTKIEVPQQFRYNMPVEALFTVVPLIMVSVFFYYTARDEDYILKTPTPATTVNVVGFQWSWAFNYNHSVTNKSQGDVAGDDGGAYDVGTPGTPPTLWLPQGEKVEFDLTSRDVIHGFWPVDFLMKMDVIPGVVNKFEVTPTALGTFRGKCTELCGVDHSQMLFNVKVVSQAAYQQHIADLRKAGQAGYVPAGITTTGLDHAK